MPNKIRTTNARAAAQSYAPRPNGSTITYGLIAAALLLVAAFIAGGFFGVDILANPLALAGMTVAAFVAGVVLRLWRQREHSQALNAEYRKRSPVKPKPAEDATGLAYMAESHSDRATSNVSQTVTFTMPFVLPGLNEPHPPGTFQLLERRERLDVSSDAFLVTKTIMLPSHGTIEALDVRADDLAEALRRDQMDTNRRAL